MRPIDFRNCAGQADDLTAWRITVGDWADNRLCTGLHTIARVSDAELRLRL
jgi:hypothetical protein